MPKRKGKKKGKIVQKKTKASVSVEEEEKMEEALAEAGMPSISESRAFQLTFEVAPSFSNADKTAYDDVRQNPQNGKSAIRSPSISSAISPEELSIKKELIEEVAGNSGISNGHLHNSTFVNFDRTGVSTATLNNVSPSSANIKMESVDRLLSLTGPFVPFTDVMVAKEEKVKSHSSCEIVTSEDTHQSVAEHQINLPACDGFLENTNSFNNFSAIVIKREVTIDYQCGTKNSEETQRIDDQGQLTGMPSTSALSETACLQQCTTIQELASTAVEENLKGDNQNKYMQLSSSDLKIKQELLDDQNNLSSITPSFGFSKDNTMKTIINCKISETNEEIQIQDSAGIEPETEFYGIRNFTTPVAFIPDNSISSSSLGKKEKEDCSNSGNSNCHLLSFSRRSSINSGGASAINSTCSELTNMEPLLAKKKSSHLSLYTGGQNKATIWPKDHQSDGIVNVGNSTPANGKQQAIYLNSLRSEEISDNYSASTSLDSYPSDTISPALSLSTMNSNTNGKFSEENKENINSNETNFRTTTPVLKSETSMAGSQICESAESEVPNAIPLPYFKGFISKWQIPVDDTGAVNENLNDDLFTEMAFFLRGEKHKPKREDNSFDFCKRTMFESICTEELHMDDRTFLFSLYRDEPPKNVETPVSDIQNNEEPADVYSIFNVNNNIIKAEPDCNISVLKIKNDETVKINDQLIETPEIECENLNNVIEPEREEPVTFNKEEALLSEVQNVQSILQGLSTQALQDIIKNAFSNTKTPSSNKESCSLDVPCIATNNSVHSELVSSTNMSNDIIGTPSLPNNSSEEMPSIVNNSCDDSDNSVGDDGRYGHSDDSEATVRNSSLDRELSPKISPKVNQKSKAKNESPEFHKRKKSRYELILERKEQEKALQIANSNLKGKNESHSQKSKSTTALTNTKHYDHQSIFTPMQRNPIDSQKRKLPLSRNKANINEKGKPTCKGAKMFASDKRKDTDLSSHRLKNRANEMENDKRSNVSNLVEMGAGNRFKNRNSSLFQDMTKCPQQPIACRNKQGRYTKTSHAVPSQPSMEEVHGQIETSISVPPAKKKLSYRDYLSRKASDPTPPLHPDKDLLRNSTRTLLPTLQPRTNYPVQDPRRGRTQTFNHGELMYISGYQPNGPTDSSVLNNPLQTIPDSHQSVSSLGPATWNCFSSNEPDASLSIDPIMNSNFLPHSNDTVTASNPLVLPPSLTPPSDDMDLCIPEPFVQHPSSGYFSSSHGIQQFGTSTSFAPSQSQGQRLAPSSPHPNMGVTPTFPPRNHLSLHPRHHEPYEINLLPNEVLASIGKTAISSSDALMVMLSWTPIWLDEADAQPLHPPPILGKKDKLLKQVKLCYEDMTDNFTTIFPLMMHDLFFRIRDMYKVSINDKTRKYELDMIKAGRVGDMMEIEAQVLLPRKTSPSIEGQLAIVTFTLMCGKKRDQFVYISYQKVYVDIPSKLMQQEILKLNMKTMFGLLNVNKKAKLTMLVFYPLTTALNQVKALSAIDESPLRDIILNPTTPSCSKFVLERIGVLSECIPIMNRAVEKIKDGISLNDPETPRVLLVDAPGATDLMSTLIAIIDDVKELKTLTQKHRILLCPRTAKRLEEIGLRLVSASGRESSSPRIQTVILAKPKIFQQPELKKLTLEDQVYQRLKFIKTMSPLEPISEEEEKLEAQKYVLGNCDVILSNIVQCHNNVVGSLFGIGKDFQFSFCIIDESYVCTEPEAFLPLLYGIKKLILVGDPHVKPRHVAYVNVPFGYYRPLPSRISQCIKQ